jgi:glucosamine--fructose-6-phosphate aminotransferase (isomerizing)
MCGIVGYIGPQEAAPLIIDGLKHLEYRGYDSAGLAVINPIMDNLLTVRRTEGKLVNLVDELRLRPADGTYGIGHTRWATHGPPTADNAHPHRDCHGDIVVVHNGAVDNYLELKEILRNEGHVITTQTDTELIAHLIEKHFQGNLESAVREAIKEIRGNFAICVISRKDPGKIVVASRDTPIIIGMGDNEYFVASAVPAILEHTREMLVLKDNDVAIITRMGVALTDHLGVPIHRPTDHVSWDPSMAEKNGYPHYMLKEIHEQPRAVIETHLGRIDGSGQVSFDQMGITAEDFRSFERIQIVACGTSFNAAQVGKFVIEQLARIPVDVDYASEFRYRDPLVDRRTLTIAISQSGETADTLAAQKEAKGKDSPTLAICNVAGSAITRAAAGTILTHAGLEIGVASTKAFTSQLVALFLLGMHLGQVRKTLDAATSQKLAAQLLALPDQIEQILGEADLFKDLARHFANADDFLFLGRGVHYPIASEGALKLKELVYRPADGLPAGEMKHGPNALIDEHLPVIMIATRNPDSESSGILYEKILSNMQEVQTRDGILIAIACKEDKDEVAKVAKHVIVIPSTHELLLPILEVVPLQLLAYGIAVRRGHDVDQPRNLAKSVTVE